MTRFITAAAASLAVLASIFTLAPAASAAPARASLTDIENDVMCVACHEPLAVAQSPQAYQERAFIRTLIAQGDTKAQIERQLVANYGPAVLGRPPAHGFNLTVYIVPPAAVLAGLAILAFTLPRWRRRVRAAASGPRTRAPTLTTAEQKRLDEELSRFAG